MDASALPCGSLSASNNRLASTFVISWAGRPPLPEALFMTMMGAALAVHPWLIVLAVAAGFVIAVAIKDAIDARGWPGDKKR